MFLLATEKWLAITTLLGGFVYQGNVYIYSRWTDYRHGESYNLTLLASRDSVGRYIIMDNAYPETSLRFRDLAREFGNGKVEFINPTEREKQLPPQVIHPRHWSTS